MNGINILFKTLSYKEWGHFAVHSLLAPSLILKRYLKNFGNEIKIKGKIFLTFRNIK